MSPAQPPRTVAASVRARLLELSRRRGVEFQLVLSEFAVERLLYRLGSSRRSRSAWDTGRMAEGRKSRQSAFERHRGNRSICWSLC